MTLGLGLYENEIDERGIKIQWILTKVGYDHLYRR
jgi:hypothetical protein